MPYDPENSYDLAGWRSGAQEFADIMVDEKRSHFKRTQRNRTILSGWKVRELYALIKLTLRVQPNGMMTRLGQGNKPMDNLWWWDFVITNGETLLNIMCSNSGVEIDTYSHEHNFVINDFLEFNMTKYQRLIDAQLELFEIHDNYINHYQSYQRIAEYLHDEIEKIDLSKPPKTSIGLDNADSEKIVKAIEQYSQNSVKFHALGKSLVLNSAFMAEAYISLISRVGSRLYGTEEKRRFKEFNKKKFEYRIRDLYQVCDAFLIEIDTSATPIQDMLKVMTLRNKYVHADLSSKLNELQPVYFDGDYPLLDSPNNNIIADSIESAFHNPSISTVKKSYDNSRRFIEYIQSLIPSSKRQMFDSILDLRIITRNRNTHRYSLIHRYDVALGLFIGPSD